MIFISHRGNISGRYIELENQPSYIDKSIELGYDVEIDLWVEENILYLGHDSPQYNISIEWIRERSNKLWIHCKNIDAVKFLTSTNDDLNYFWHQSDDISITSKKFIWVFPGKQPIVNSVAVLPELNNDDCNKCVGICSDFISDYKQKFQCN